MYLLNLSPCPYCLPCKPSSSWPLVQSRTSSTAHLFLFWSQSAVISSSLPESPILISGNFVPQGATRIVGPHFLNACASFICFQRVLLAAFQVAIRSGVLSRVCVPHFCPPLMLSFPITARLFPPMCYFRAWFSALFSRKCLSNIFCIPCHYLLCVPHDPKASQQTLHVRAAGVTMPLFPTSYNTTPDFFLPYLSQTCCFLAVLRP